ncbi:MAG: KH domain-containing protein [Clostridia bacterium]|nr:KH domain-containing protein [Clostridia bacterium]
MEEMLKLLVKELVSNPDQISINKREEGNTTTLELKVAPEDMGKVIGRQGKIAKSIRILMKAYGAKNNQKINVDILD